jgi:serine/threonine protein phosphatase PrpC
MNANTTRILDVAGASRVGHRRARNEDTFGWFVEGRIIVLADGMGERPHGGIASTLALHEAQACVDASGLTADEIDALDRFGAATWIRSMFRAARHALTAANATVELDTKMESTLMVGVLTHAQVVVGHAGHSRCYLWRRGELTQLTRDHRRHPPGLDELEDEDRRALRPLVCIADRGVGGVSGDDPEITAVPIEEGDVLLFCSNGVSDALPPSDLASYFAPTLAAGSIADELLAASESAGAEDDATAIVVRIGALLARAPIANERP